MTLLCKIFGHVEKTYLRVHTIINKGVTEKLWSYRITECKRCKEELSRTKLDSKETEEELTSFRWCDYNGS